MKISLRALLLMCLILLALPVLAADDATDNACHDGGARAGTCDWPTAAEREWAWTCGWYIARAEHSVITPDAVPSWCGYQTTAISAPICYKSSISGRMDIQLTGPLSTVNNTRTYESYNGDCTGTVYLLTYVDASDVNNATTKCQALLMDVRYKGTLVSTWGYPTPANWYYCEFIT